MADTEVDIPMDDAADDAGDDAAAASEVGYRTPGVHWIHVGLHCLCCLLLLLLLFLFESRAILTWRKRDPDRAFQWKKSSYLPPTETIASPVL
jgi:hypothetical protein